MTPLQKKTAATTVAAFSLLGTLAGCAAAADTGATGTDSQVASDATYTDGTYDATADYQSPNGTETIDVELTLADNVITAVTVTGHGTSPDSQHYQGEFTDGIADVVVGKDINSITVDKVAGSSLTSGGFNAAVEQIKAEAVA
jgi:uncharacterized protein with FMN-binding domain